MICLVDGKNRQMLTVICAAGSISIQFNSITDLYSAVRRCLDARLFTDVG